jgi:hypothetical protein
MSQMIIDEKWYEIGFVEEVKACPHRLFLWTLGIAYSDTGEGK